MSSLFEFLTAVLIGALGIGTGIAFILAYAMFSKPKNDVPSWLEFNEDYNVKH